ncbi:MAG: SPOR domain-containing protein [Bacteroidota bacterium]|nr:SPOR domain-containing protein [Bacteroidota bacterium]
MPLNIKDKEDFPSEEKLTPPPILHTPKEDRTVVRYVLFTIFILLVLSSVILLLYLFVYKGGTETTSTDQSSPESLPATVIEQPIQTVPPAQVVELPKIQEIEKPITSGNYTVYIASYVVKQPAEDEVARWNEAGFQASVVEANNHFRVSLGEYVSVKDADTFAVRMWEAFECGYWIGSLR